MYMFESYSEGIKNFALGNMFCVLVEGRNFPRITTDFKVIDARHVCVPSTLVSNRLRTYELLY